MEINLKNNSITYTYNSRFLWISHKNEGPSIELITPNIFLYIYNRKNSKESSSITFIWYNIYLKLNIKPWNLVIDLL